MRTINFERIKHNFFKYFFFAVKMILVRMITVVKRFMKFLSKNMLIKLVQVSEILNSHRLDNVHPVQVPVVPVQVVQALVMVSIIHRKQHHIRAAQVGVREVDSLSWHHSINLVMNKPPFHWLKLERKCVQKNQNRY